MPTALTEPPPPGMGAPLGTSAEPINHPTAEKQAKHRAHRHWVNPSPEDAGLRKRPWSVTWKGGGTAWPRKKEKGKTRILQPPPLHPTALALCLWLQNGENQRHGMGTLSNLAPTLSNLAPI